MGDDMATVQERAMYAAHAAVREAQKGGYLAPNDVIGAASLGVLKALDVAWEAWAK